MDAYLELRLRPDPEFSADMLLNALFAKLHRALVSHGEGRIGVSFPDVHPAAGHLGGRVRLHGQAADLAHLMAQPWLLGMRDHLADFTIAPVPEGALHRIVRRVQAKSSVARQRRRLMRRCGVDAAAAVAAIPDHAAERLTLPCVVLTSRSTQQQFRLFIAHLPLQPTASAGRFSAYGLSDDASIPWF